MAKIHDKYGHIVHIGRDRLAVDGSISWSQRDADRRRRRVMASASSEPALREQEPTIKSYVDPMIDRL
ncbi:hypothetical protein PspLS_08217 [Pyricularia sp. CBS 133598]|nr:hypothetical protein PspLS_08217 [Pyricularia sp. CBS 133598]